MSMIDAEIQIETESSLRRQIQALRRTVDLMETAIRNQAQRITELEAFRDAQLDYVKTNEADKHAMESRIARLESRTKYMPDDPEDIMAIFRTEAAAKAKTDD